MKSRPVIFATAVLALTMILASLAASEDKKAAMSEQEMMAVWARYAQPGEKHKFLEPLIGSWDCVAKSFMDPSGQPKESKATCEARWILGGRFMQEDVAGDMGGTPFKGMGITGYDNIKEQYFSFWVDEMATSFMLTSGKIDPAGKTFVMEGSYTDPSDNMKVKKFKTITRITSNDQHSYEMYDIGPDGKEVKTMEIVYNRKK